MTKDEKAQKLQELKVRMEEDATLPLKKGATKLVFGDGNPDSAILFIGEGPGYFEDQKGIPFVGNAGALLNYLLRLIKIERSDVFITNIVHHRPPENRDPEPAEIAAYGKYLDEIIKIINPQVIVTLGRFSMAKFIPGVFISSVHGRERIVTIDNRDVMVIPMYHPAAALRSLDVKAKLTEDFSKIPVIIKRLKDSKKVEVEENTIKEDNGSKQMNLI
jgi:DNA polymerase